MHRPGSQGRVASCLGLIVLLATAGCATVPAPREPHDPWEGFNRGVYRFNDTLDRAVVKPVAQAYQRVTPAVVNRSVTNFFNNLNDVVVVANDLLQLKIEQAVADLGRFVLNSTFGVAGLFDLATPYGLEKHDEDFGQTLGYWGLGQGPYLVLPLLGPSTVRDTFGLAGDIAVSPVFTEDVALRNSLLGLRTVDLRADLLSAGRIAEVAALDEYVFLRDAYLQRRRYQVYDGNPPLEPFDDEDADEAPEEGPSPPAEAPGPP